MRSRAFLEAMVPLRVVLWLTAAGIAYLCAPESVHANLDEVETVIVRDSLILDEGFAGGVDFDGDSLLIASFRASRAYERDGMDWRLTDFLEPFPSISFPASQYGAHLMDGSAVVMNWFITLLEQEHGQWVSQGFLLDEAGYPILADRTASDGHTLVVGERGSDGTIEQPLGRITILEKDEDGWTIQARFLEPDSDNPGYRSGSFGETIAVDGDTVLASNYHGICDSRDDGGVFVYERQEGEWIAQGKLEADSRYWIHDCFGGSLAVQGNTAVVGAPGSNYYSTAGSVFIFERQDEQWLEVQHLDVPPRPSNPDRCTPGAPVEPHSCDRDYFGLAVAIEGDLLAVATPYDDDFAGPGAIYLYERTDDGWQLTKRLEPDTSQSPQRTNQVTDHLLIVDDTVVFELDGAYSLSVGTTNRFDGIYFHHLPQENGEPCELVEQCTSNFCVDGVCCDTECGLGVLDCQACSMIAGSAVDGECGPLVPELAETVVCREALDECDATEFCQSDGMTCPEDGSVPEGETCGGVTEACVLPNECDGQGSCIAGDIAVDGTACDDNDLFCDGEGTCDAGTCVSSGSPCTDDGVCDEDLDQCVQLACGAEGAACEDNGVFCDGVERCEDALCVSAGNPCGDGQTCSEEDEICIPQGSNGGCGCQLAPRPVSAATWAFFLLAMIATIHRAQKRHVRSTSREG